MAGRPRPRQAINMPDEALAQLTQITGCPQRPLWILLVMEPRVVQVTESAAVRRCTREAVRAAKRIHDEGRLKRQFTSGNNGADPSVGSGRGAARGGLSIGWEATGVWFDSTESMDVGDAGLFFVVLRSPLNVSAQHVVHPRRCIGCLDITARDSTGICRCSMRHGPC